MSREAKFIFVYFTPANCRRMLFIPRSFILTFSSNSSVHNLGSSFSILDFQYKLFQSSQSFLRIRVNLSIFWGLNSLYDLQFRK